MLINLSIKILIYQNAMSILIISYRIYNPIQSIKIPCIWILCTCMKLARLLLSMFALEFVFITILDRHRFGFVTLLVFECFTVTSLVSTFFIFLCFYATCFVFFYNRYGPINFSAHVFLCDALWLMVLQAISFVK